MVNKTSQVLTALSVILLLQLGCDMPRGRHDESPAASIVANELARTTQSWDGKLLPAYPQGQPMITIMRISIPAGAQLKAHTHPVINAGFLISGQLAVVTTDGKELHLKAGDPIVEVVNTLHYGVNQGKVPAEIVVFYAGVVGKPITVIEPRLED